VSVAERHPGSATRRFAAALPASWPAWCVLALATALLVVVDPYLSSLVPRSVWVRWHLGDLPVRLSVLGVLALVGGTLAARVLAASGAGTDVAAGRYDRVFLIALFVAAQANGLRVGFLDVLDVVTVTFLLIWLAEQLVRGSGSVLLPGVVWFGLALLALAVPGLLEQNPVRFLFGVLGLAKVVLVSFLMVNIIRDEKRLRLGIDVFLVVAAGSALIALAQFLLAWLWDVRITLARDVDEMMKATPIGTVMRASGLSVTAQHVSGYLTLALPFLLWRVTTAGARWRLPLLAALPIVLLAILVTWNFGAILVGCGVLALFPFLRWPHATPHLLLAAIVLLLVGYHAGLIQWTYDVIFASGGSSKGFIQRQALMDFGFEKLQRNPWLGTGLRGMARFSGNYWHRPVHNAYMQAMTEIGLLAGLVLASMLLTQLTQLALLGLRVARRAGELIWPPFLAVLALAALMFAEPMLDHSNTWLLLGLTQCSILVLSGRSGARSPDG
jgi:hypothetical protein